MFDALMKATVGLLVETPIALAADVLTLGGALTDREEPHTVTSLGKVIDNIAAATED